MKRILLFLICLLILNCSAPIRMATYPGKDITNIPESQCKVDYEEVIVLGQLPPADEYIQIGYMIVSQESSSSLVETSNEEQIKAARIQACQWGADAIVIIESESDKGTTFDFWEGAQYYDEKSTRVIAIKFTEQEE